jgi:methylenetetrahydrofolate reductase (NADPH)
MLLRWDREYYYSKSIFSGAIVTNFRQAAIAGEFLITAEVAPPKGGNVAHMVEMASCLKGRVHAVNITE